MAGCGCSHCFSSAEKYTNTNTQQYKYKYASIQMQIQLPEIAKLCWSHCITSFSKEKLHASYQKHLRPQRSKSFKYFLLVFQVSTFRFYLDVLDCEVARYYIFSDIFTYDVPPVISSLTQFRKLPPKTSTNDPQCCHRTNQTRCSPHITPGPIPTV